MWDDYTTLAYQRLQELYDDASVRRSLPPKPRRVRMPREMLGRALVRWGERLVSPVGAPVAHR
jgi:hypothetical protein